MVEGRGGYFWDGVRVMESEGDGGVCIDVGIRMIVRTGCGLGDFSCSAMSEV